MDVTVGPPPTIQDAFLGFLHDTKLFSWGTVWNTIGDYALVSMAGAFMTRGTMTAVRFTVHKGLPRAALWVLPSTVAVAQPGVIHVIFDLSFYKGWKFTRRTSITKPS